MDDVRSRTCSLIYELIAETKQNETTILNDIIPDDVPVYESRRPRVSSL